MSRVAAGCSVALVAAVVMLALLGPLLVSVLAPDAEAVPAARRLLPDAKGVLSRQLDLPPSVIRFTGIEMRDDDQLVIMRFELRAFPFIFSEGAYLGSRCTPLDELDPASMGGGRGIVDFETDPELEYLRSGAQPACPE